jgi:hypothetical protein
VRHVRGRADGAGEGERQLVRHRRAEEPLRVEPLLDEHRIEDLRLARELLADAVHVLVSEQVEVRRLEERRDLIERGLLGEDRAEHRLLRLEAVREVARGAEGGDGGFGGPADGIVLGHGRRTIAAEPDRIHRR